MITESTENAGQDQHGGTVTRGQDVTTASTGPQSLTQSTQQNTVEERLLNAVPATRASRELEGHETQKQAAHEIPAVCF